jgi:hypothetical protein
MGLPNIGNKNTKYHQQGMHDKAIKHASAMSTNAIINHTHCNNHQPHPPTATTTPAPQHGQHLLVWHENLQQDIDEACYAQTSLVQHP